VRVALPCGSAHAVRRTRTVAAGYCLNIGSRRTKAFRGREP
jgi:hypothetical protein